MKQKIAWMVCAGFIACMAQGALVTDDFESYSAGSSVARRMKI